LVSQSTSPSFKQFKAQTLAYSSLNLQDSLVTGRELTVH
jgi:hypothetical protein